MDNLVLHGSPFLSKYSSCSIRTPRMFSWSDSVNENTIGLVHCDYSILESMSERSTSQLPRYAWLVESPEILNVLISRIKSNADLISYTYKALFTCCEELVGYRKNFFYCPSGSNLPHVLENEYQIYPKTKICSLVASPKQWLPGHKIRHEIANRFGSSIDLFGGVNGSSRLGSNSQYEDKILGLRDYRFSFIVENCIRDKYYTEKLTDCFATGTIPIYWGTRKAAEDFVSQGIIWMSDINFNIDSLTPDLYSSKLSAIQENYRRVQNLKMADDFLYEKIKSI